MRKKWGLQVDDAQRQLLEDTIDHAIAYGAAKAKELAAKDGTVDVGNATLKLAADYANAHAPDALAHFGVTDEQLAKKIVAQLPQPAA